MSFRLLAIRLTKHGRKFLQSYWKRDIHTNILEQNRIKDRIPNSVVRSLPARSGIFRFGQHARKLFIDNILNRCTTTTYSDELRSRATKKLFYGDSAPFFALIGVGLASGAGVLTKEDELEGVCWEIREAATRLQTTWNREHISETLKTDFGIDKLDIGPPIAKGCAAVVYAAAFKNVDTSVMNESEQKASCSANASEDEEAAAAATTTTTQRMHNITLQQIESLCPEMMSPIQNMSRFVHNFGGSVDNLNNNCYRQQTTTTVAALLEQYDARQRIAPPQGWESTTTTTTHHSTTTTNRNNVTTSQMNILADDARARSIRRYPLALKMMFNYDIQSNAIAILRAMYKETVPARQRHLGEDKVTHEWERLLQNQTLTLAPHPNIVCMFGFFCDEVRNLADGHLLYPFAQPQRINPLGYGRNMSLYLLMRRYDCSLRQLLDTTELSVRTKLLLFTQLLEAVTHCNRHSIAHRDLKSDNILIEMNEEAKSAKCAATAPILVLTDFGCCLADKVHGLQLPYTSHDIDKGGNAALMAPEIISKQPGTFAVLDYAKADLWACGAIAYEIFGLRNPFYSGSAGADNESNSLRNVDYKDEDLPPLCSECPPLVQKLIYNILKRNPTKRVSPDVAANIMQLFLWAPSNWLKEGGMPNSPQILQWLLSLSTKVMCEGRLSATATQALNFSHTGNRTYVDYLLICSFLARARLRRIRGALYWIQNVA